MAKSNMTEEDLRNKGLIETSPGVWERAPVIKKHKVVPLEKPMLERAGTIIKQAEEAGIVELPPVNEVRGHALLVGGYKPEKMKLKAKTERRQVGKMNKAELKYSEHLNQLLRSGEIFQWDFEPEKFRLADNTYYTPDFRIITKAGFIEFHEVKAFWKSANRVGWMEDARVKIKVAAEQHPYHFCSVCWNKDKWEYENF